MVTTSKPKRSFGWLHVVYECHWRWERGMWLRHYKFRLRIMLLFTWVPNSLCFIRRALISGCFLQARYPTRLQGLHQERPISFGCPLLQGLEKEKLLALSLYFLLTLVKTYYDKCTYSMTEKILYGYTVNTEVRFRKLTNFFNSSS